MYQYNCRATPVQLMMPLGWKRAKISGARVCRPRHAPKPSPQASLLTL
jgi:hypothetical protein